MNNKFKCIECLTIKPIKLLVYQTNWCVRCYENELWRSYKEDSVSTIIGHYPTKFSRPQKFKLDPSEYKKHGY
jgi:hypothetical protein